MLLLALSYTFFHGKEFNDRLRYDISNEFNENIFYVTKENLIARTSIFIIVESLCERVTKAFSYLQFHGCLRKILYSKQFDLSGNKRSLLIGKGFELRTDDSIL